MSDRGDLQHNNFWRILWTFHSKLDGSSVMFLYGCTLLVLTALYSLLDRHSIWANAYIEMEAEQTISYILHTQQEYFLDRQTFTRQLNSLETDFETEDYYYRILFPSQPFQAELSSEFESQNFPAIATVAYPKRDRFSVYIGIAKTAVDLNTNELKTQSIFCQSVSSLETLKSQENIDFGFPYFTDPDRIISPFTCPANFKVIK
ncbi:MAG: type IV pilin-like G/H family protein [Cyanobacteria bacterium P01_E01_bin.42]